MIRKATQTMEMLTQTYKNDFYKENIDFLKFFVMVFFKT